VSRVILLSLFASFNPTLVAATTLMLLLDHPVKLMTGYLVGALITSVSLGLIIVFSLLDSSAVNTTRRTVNPAVDILFGVIALAGAELIHRGSHSRIVVRWRSHRRSRDKAQPRWQRELSKGSPRVTVIVGALLTLPGASYLLGLSHIHRLGYSTGVTVLVIVGFNLVMLWLLEVPLLCFVLAPERTPRAIEAVKVWLSRQGARILVRGLVVLGLLLIVKGTIGLL
jgi:Sap, sulfolipid-1-addressing protein